MPVCDDGSGSQGARPHGDDEDSAITLEDWCGAKRTDIKYAASLQLRSGEAERARLSIDHRETARMETGKMAKCGRRRGVRQWRAVHGRHRPLVHWRASLERRFPGFQTNGGCRLESRMMEVSGIWTSVEVVSVGDRPAQVNAMAALQRQSLLHRWWCCGLAHSRLLRKTDEEG